MAISTSTAVALALAAASAGGQYYNTQKTAERQDNQLAAQLRQQGKRQHEADAKVTELIDKRAASSPEDERAGMLEGYLATIRAQSGNANAGLSQAGAVSDAYRESSNEAALGVSDYGKQVAGLLSRMDAPALQRQREGMESARFESDINRIKRFSMGDDYLAKLRLDQIRRNPWIDAASALAGGAAGAMGTTGTSAAETAGRGLYGAGFRGIGSVGY